MIEEGPVISNIKTRRSVRNYADRPVSDEVIESIIDAGIHAPTGLGLQPWRFVVIRDKDIMKQMSTHCKPKLLKQLEGVNIDAAAQFKKMLRSEEFDIFYNAPVLIIVLGNKNAPTADFDCAMCAQNMMLAAHSMGLGSCWIGTACLVQDNPEMLQKLKIPEDHKVVAPIIFGYGGTVPAAPPRNDPVITWI
ncbi:MAG: nitroreductase A [Methanomethylovorans sp. PtaU1.Bin093]|jgi:nitroreductase|uniref:nitroreductase family protein n=1 Tax=Methanomethylovorans sp. PtaU1.Bin093 TaxID=1811679 RepID=UPI0009D16170|nr:nitroreductase family protein [Methanomethylovorans sp. PtaU1.Bin093]OPY18697.1 MAG: nitroreductase A [Methanomethylovorans sp. PtaU1.Bin093]